MKKPDQNEMFKVQDKILDLVERMPAIKSIYFRYDDHEMTPLLKTWDGVSLSESETDELTDLLYDMIDNNPVITDAVNAFKSQEFVCGFKPTLSHVIYMSLRIMKAHGVDRLILKGVGTDSVSVKAVSFARGVQVDRKSPAILSIIAHLEAIKDLDFSKISSYRADDKSICFGVKR